MPIRLADHICSTHAGHSFATHMLETGTDLEKGSAGARYHAVAEEGLPLRDIAETTGRTFNVRIISKSSQEAAKLFTWLTPFAADNPVSSKLTQERLAWRPT